MIIHITTKHHSRTPIRPWVRQTNIQSVNTSLPMPLILPFPFPPFLPPPPTPTLRTSPSRSPPPHPYITHSAWMDPAAISLASVQTKRRSLGHLYAQPIQHFQYNQQNSSALTTTTLGMYVCPPLSPRESRECC